MIWCGHKVNGHFCWFIPADHYLDMKTCSEVSNGVVCPITGSFSGKQGVSVDVKVEKCPHYGDRC